MKKTGIVQKCKRKGCNLCVNTNPKYIKMQKVRGAQYKLLYCCSACCILKDVKKFRHGKLCEGKCFTCKTNEITKTNKPSTMLATSNKYDNNIKLEINETPNKTTNKQDFFKNLPKRSDLVTNNLDYTLLITHSDNKINGMFFAR